MHDPVTLAGPQPAVKWIGKGAQRWNSNVNGMSGAFDGLPCVGLWRKHICIENVEVINVIAALWIPRRFRFGGVLRCRVKGGERSNPSRVCNLKEFVFH